MTQKCDHCEGPSVHWQRYSGARHCGRHFIESVEKRVAKELSRQAELPRGARLLVAYSGGKDSTAALQLTVELRQRRPDIVVGAVTIDEGIEGYRPAALELAAATCGRLGVEHIVKRTVTLAGKTMDAIQATAGDGIRACGYCGVFRRRLMNDAAKEWRADFLVTGHNLDDVAQSILMNLTSANLDQLARLGPHDLEKPGLVRRLMPLRLIPETEVYLYAFLKGLQWHDEECPYSHDAQRQTYRDVLYTLEEARPGTRHALLRTHEAVRPLLQGQNGEKVGQCPECAEPSSGGVCKACQFRAAIAPTTHPQG